VVYFIELSRYSLKETEEIDEQPQSGWSVTQLRLKLGAFRIQG